MCLGNTLHSRSKRLVTPHQKQSKRTLVSRQTQNNIKEEFQRPRSCIEPAQEFEVLGEGVARRDEQSRTPRILLEQDKCTELAEPNRYAGQWQSAKCN